MKKTGTEKNRALKMTPQRMAILNYLEGNKEHPSAEDIYRAITKLFPTMSLATVYNTLETLKEHGQIRELYCDPFKKRFDPNPLPHHHVICLRCQKILDVQVDLPLHPPTMASEEFEMMGYHIEFYGLCSTCRDKK